MGKKVKGDGDKKKKKKIKRKKKQNQEVDEETISLSDDPREEVMEIMDGVSKDVDQEPVFPE